MALSLKLDPFACWANPGQNQMEVGKPVQNKLFILQPASKILKPTKSFHGWKKEWKSRGFPIFERPGAGLRDKKPQGWKMKHSLGRTQNLCLPPICRSKSVYVWTTNRCMLGKGVCQNGFAPRKVCMHWILLTTISVFSVVWWCTKKPIKRTTWE